VKKVIGLQGNNEGHWVGDGFPVRTLFFYQNLGRQMSPFLMLDYAGPYDFESTAQKKGVGSHPHRGFETVTIVYQGEVAHRDSTGQGGVIGPGDVQWMTAGSGILHEEFHSEQFAKQGGTLEMVQLWVNLPAKNKMTPPKYQPILGSQISVIELDNDSGYIRVIAGSYKETTGPAQTFTPMNVWDMRLKAGTNLELPISDGWSASIVVLRGAIEEQTVTAKEGQMMMYSKDGENLRIQVVEDSTLLLLSGEPIDEPIVGYGPFVMNNQEEIKQAIHDFNRGEFGRL